jgi:hypothetical protein
MKRTSLLNFFSIAALLLVSFSFGGSTQATSPTLPTELVVPDSIAGIPGVTGEWWSAVQAQLPQDLGAVPELSTTPDWSAQGFDELNSFGFSTASVGDVNGDGYADLAVGAYRLNTFTGIAYVYHGSASGLSLTANWSVVGEATNSNFGYSVSSAGDVNGDGYSDLVVGAYGYNNATGKAYVYHGSASGLSASADWTAVGEAAGSYFGLSAASARDVDADGYADLAVGAPFNNNSTGKAYVYRGSVGGLSASADWSAAGEATSNAFGGSIASAGDVNGDGYADLTVGAWGFASNTGKAYVYHGSASGLSPTSAWSAVGEATGDFFSRWVAPAGDVNGDGYADLGVGAFGYSNITGKIYIYHGSVGSLSLTADWNAVGEAANNYFGRSVASAGDVNGDGYTDLAVGAWGYSSGTGKAYIYHGSASGLSTNAGWSAVGEGTSDNFGLSVASAGDVNGDGFSDLAVGAPGYNFNMGKAYVYHGSAVPAGCTTNCLRVAAIGMRVDPSFVHASVTVRDENSSPVPRAVVSVRWDLPGGGEQELTKKTNASGVASFRVSGGVGTYTITVNDVVLAGYAFDPENSAILSKSITK